MRTIKFRGKRIDNGKWVYGDLITEKGTYICYYNKENEWLEVKVIPETVGQFTGLLDKNGKEIFEGDVVNINEVERKYIVKFHNGCFKLFHADPKLNGMLWGTVERVSEMIFNIEVVNNN